MSTKILGILGGVGPLASVYFSSLIVSMTKAEKDQDHIPFFLYNDIFIPDRTDFITGKSVVNPLPDLLSGIHKLESIGCDYAAVTCNTAHYFYNEMAAEAKIPVVNMVEEAVKYALRSIPEAKKIGVLATNGTVSSGVYKKAAEKYGLEYVVPDENDQNTVTDIIYNQVKAGRPVDFKRFTDIINRLRKAGCDAVILGCTELSVINKDHNLSKENSDIVDAMEALAIKCIRLCGKEVKE